ADADGRGRRAGERVDRRRRLGTLRRRPARLVALGPPPEAEQRPGGEGDSGGGAERRAELLPALGRLTELLPQRGDGVREFAALVRDLAPKIRLRRHCAAPPWSAVPPRSPAREPASRPSAAGPPRFLRGSR